MRAHDWIYVGVKLMGIYYLIIGIVYLLTALAHMSRFGLADSETYRPNLYSFIDLVEPAVYIGVGWIMTRCTSTVFNFMHINTPNDAPAPPPATQQTESELTREP